jgi:hypothetical protein
VESGRFAFVCCSTVNGARKRRLVGMASQWLLAVLQEAPSNGLIANGRQLCPSLEHLCGAVLAHT